MPRDDDDLDRPSKGSGGGGKDIPNNLVIAILSVFCCWPLAIVAIIKAASVNGLVAQGKYAEAEAASASAKKFALIGIILGLVLQGGYVVFVVLLGIGGAAAGGR